MNQGLAASALAPFNPYVARIGLTLLQTGKRFRHCAETMRQAVKSFSGYTSLTPPETNYSFERASLASFDEVTYPINQPRANQHGIFLEETTQNLAPANLATLWNNASYQYTTGSAEGAATYGLEANTHPKLTLLKTDAGTGAFGWRTSIYNLSGPVYTVSLDVWPLSTTGRFTLFASFSKSGGSMQATTRVNLSELTPNTWNRVTVTYPATGSNTLSGSGNVYAYIDQEPGSCHITRLQVETKAYATSYMAGGTARSPEQILVSTQNHFSKSGWHVAVTLTPERVNEESIIWQLDCGTQGYYKLHHVNGELQFSIKAGANTYSATTTCKLSDLNVYRIAVSGNGSRAGICVNGQFVGELVYLDPVEDLGSALVFKPKNTYVRDMVLGDLALSDEALQAESLPEPAVRLMTQPAIDALKYKGFEVDFSSFPDVNLGPGQILDATGSVITVPAKIFSLNPAEGQTWYVFLDYQGEPQVATTVPDNAVLVLKQFQALGSQWANIQTLPIAETHYFVDDFLAVSTRTNGPLVLDTVTYTYTAMDFVDVVTSKTRQGQSAMRYAYDPAGQILAFEQS